MDMFILSYQFNLFLIRDPEPQLRLTSQLRATGCDMGDCVAPTLLSYFSL